MPKRTSVQTADQYWVKEHNLAILLRKAWAAKAPISRPELTRLSGLNKMTVNNLVAELEEMHLVQSQGTYQPSNSGRPGSLYTIDPAGGLIIGIEIDIGVIHAVLADFSGNVLWRTVEDVKVEDENIYEQAETVVDSVLKVAESYEPNVIGIGVAVAAPVSKEGEIALSPGTFIPVHVRVAAKWEEKFHLPVFIMNDGNASAIGAQILGDVGFDEDFIFINAGEGLGAGIISDGEIFLGAGGFAGEVGHITIDFEGIPCKCGNRGCLENYVSLTAAIERWRTHSSFNASRYEDSLTGHTNRDFLVLVDAASAGDEAAIDVLNQIGRFFGIGLSSLINTFNPRYIFLGGSLCEGGAYILPALISEINQRCFKFTRSNLQEVKVVEHPYESAVMGAISLVIKEVLTSPSRWYSRMALEGRYFGLVNQ
jgi:predicted NBD/HSP70 family sugar kinase